MSDQNTSLKLHFIPQDELEARLDKIENKIDEALIGLKGELKGTSLPTMLTSDQVMEALNIKRWKFDQLIADGELNYVRKGRKIYVPESSIRDYFGIK